MMSTAVYSKIDPGTPAAFSHAIVTGMLREQLGFRGVVISDDVGAAKQVATYPVGERAVRFVAAGGDMVLTVDATQAGAMCDALYARAASDPAFRSTGRCRGPARARRQAGARPAALTQAISAA